MQYNEKLLQLQYTSMLEQAEVYVSSNMENNGCPSSGIHNDQLSTHMHTEQYYDCNQALGVGGLMNVMDSTVYSSGSYS